MPAPSSRERLLAALRHEEADHVPCCFSAFSSLREKCSGQREFVERQLAMGLDVAVRLEDLPFRHHPEVAIREERETRSGEPYPLLTKEYRTPAGTLVTEVSRTDDWPWGDHVPFADDFLIPRSRRFPIQHEGDLEALRFLLAPPSHEDAADLRTRAAEARELAMEHGLLVTGGMSMGGDMAAWLLGIEGVMLAVEDRPEFVRELLAVIEEWDRRRTALVLEQGVDVLLRRGWYEHADFWSPARYRELLLPALRRSAEQVHAAGARLGYIMSCSLLPLVDQMMEAGVDVLLGIDPAQDRRMDRAELKRRTAGRLALWGGVCGYLTVEVGRPEDVAAEVRESIRDLAPGGGFILSPVTNIRAGTERAWRNVDALIGAWREARAYPVRRGRGRGA